MDIISARRFEDGVYMKVCYDAEDALARLAQARVRAPNLQRRAYLVRRNRLARWARRILPGTDADLFFGCGRELFLFMMGPRREFGPLMRDWRRRKRVYLFDSWEPVWESLEKDMREWRNIDHVWMASRQAAEHFRTILPYPVTWLPQAADPAEFAEAEKRVAPNSRRSVLNIGRRNRKLDEFFESFCNKHDFAYLRDDIPGIPTFPSRKHFARQLVASQIVVVHPRNLDEPNITGCVSTLTARYFEAYNSGAVVCGFRPSSGEFEDTFGALPFVEYEDPVSFERNLLRELERSAVWSAAKQDVRVRHTWDARARDLVAGLTVSCEGRAAPT